MTVPSWLNEKAPGVSVNRVFWTSTILSTLLYTSVGVLGALAFAEVPENMLSLLVSEQVGLLTRLSGILFGVLIIGPAAGRKVCPGSFLHRGLDCSEGSFAVGVHSLVAFGFAEVGLRVLRPASGCTLLGQVSVCQSSA